MSAPMDFLPLYTLVAAMGNAILFGILEHKTQMKGSVGEIKTWFRQSLIAIKGM